VVAALTALDVAFITAMAAVAAAVAAPISAWVVASSNSKHDRWVKTYDDLHDAYSKLLEGIIGTRSALLLLARAYEKNDPGIYRTPLEEDEALRIERLANVTSLASRRVADAIDEWETAWRKHVLPTLEGLGDATPGECQESAAKIRASLKAVDETWDRLRDAIRQDLRNR
jgi:hypothetical protein